MIMTKDVAIEYLMSLGWNRYGAEAIVDEIETSELAKMTCEQLKKISDDYISR